ncbi:MAG: DNA-3-methyladenine glycosylase I, partial [Bacteroidetes bacterium HGW-Bacteroidetes-23]
EFLILETFQAGVSWHLILKKRENFRKAFLNFDYKQIALFGDYEVQELMKDAGIIRNTLKINSAISNAKAFMKVQEEFGSFSKFIWSYVDGKPIVNNFTSFSEVPAYSPLAEKISKDLKKRGFKFIGPTTMYAHMQATGMVNDHFLDCWKRN